MKKQVISVRNILLGTRIGYADVTLEKAKTFTLNKKNRKVERRHLLRIKREMQDVLWSMSPIIVNVVTGNIIDGQHRHRAFIELMEDGLVPKDYLLGVMYVSMSEEAELEEIERINNNNKQWSVATFVNKHIDEESYNRLVEFGKSHLLTCDKNGVKLRYTSSMVKGVCCTDLLKSGLFKASDEEFERAEHVHYEMLNLIEALDKPKKGPYLESMAMTWIKFRERYDFATWMEEFNSTDKYKKMPSNNKKQWEELFAVAHSSIEMKNK